MEAAFGKQNSWASGGSAGKLDGRFNAFGTAIGEVHAIKPAADALREFARQHSRKGRGVKLHHGWQVHV